MTSRSFRVDRQTNRPRMSAFQRCRISAVIEEMMKWTLHEPRYRAATRSSDYAEYFYPDSLKTKVGKRLSWIVRNSG